MLPRADFITILLDDWLKYKLHYNTVYWSHRILIYIQRDTSIFVSWIKYSFSGLFLKLFKRPIYESKGELQILLHLK